MSVLRYGLQDGRLNRVCSFFGRVAFRGEIDVAAVLAKVPVMEEVQIESLESEKGSKLEFRTVSCPEETVSSQSA